MAGSSSSVSHSESYSDTYIPEYSESPILREIALHARSMSDQVYAWGMDQFNKGQADIDGLMRDALSYASPQRIAVDMGMAEAGVQQAAERGRLSAIRDLESYGIDPSSGRYAQLDMANRVMSAAAAAGAGNQQRMADQAAGNAMRNQAISAGLQNRQFGLGVGNSANAFLQTGMSLKYPPLGRYSTSVSDSSSSSVQTDKPTPPKEEKPPQQPQPKQQAAGGAKPGGEKDGSGGGGGGKPQAGLDAPPKKLDEGGKPGEEKPGEEQPRDFGDDPGEGTPISDNSGASSFDEGGFGEPLVPADEDPLQPGLVPSDEDPLEPDPFQGLTPPDEAGLQPDPYENMAPPDEAGFQPPRDFGDDPGEGTPISDPMRGETMVDYDPYTGQPIDTAQAFGIDPETGEPISAAGGDDTLVGEGADSEAGSLYAGDEWAEGSLLDATYGGDDAESMWSDIGQGEDTGAYDSTYDSTSYEGFDESGFEGVDYGGDQDVGDQDYGDYGGDYGTDDYYDYGDTSYEGFDEGGFEDTDWGDADYGDAGDYDDSDWGDSEDYYDDYEDYEDYGDDSYEDYADEDYYDDYADEDYYDDYADEDYGDDSYEDYADDSYEDYADEDYGDYGEGGDYGGDEYYDSGDYGGDYGGDEGARGGAVARGPMERGKRRARIMPPGARPRPRPMRTGFRPRPPMRRYAAGGMIPPQGVGARGPLDRPPQRPPGGRMRLPKPQQAPRPVRGAPPGGMRPAPVGRGPRMPGNFISANGMPPPTVGGMQRPVQRMAQGGQAGRQPEPTQGGFVSRSLSPSGGSTTDDVQARLNAGEFVIPKDVATWKGKEFFYKMIAQARKNRSAPNGGTDKPQVGYGNPRGMR